MKVINGNFGKDKELPPASEAFAAFSEMCKDMEDELGPDCCEVVCIALTPGGLVIGGNNPSAAATNLMLDIAKQAVVSMTTEGYDDDETLH